MALPARWLARSAARGCQCAQLARKAPLAARFAAARRISIAQSATQLLRDGMVQRAIDHVAHRLTQRKRVAEKREGALDTPTVHIEDDLRDDDLRCPDASSVPPLPAVPITDPFALVHDEVASLSSGIKSILGSDHPVLRTVAQYFFEHDTGKKIRPAMVLLMARAAASQKASASPGSVPKNGEADLILEKQRRLAEITELIHTASLLHDDVIDDADTRRGVSSVNQVFGNKLAILAGDFLLARASLSLARLRNVEVVEVLSTVIEHLVRGEVMQMRGSPEDGPFVGYLRKTYFKTGSLMANSLRATAILGEHDTPTQAAAFEYGKHIGLAFQLVDDWLDYTESAASLGKPAMADIKGGVVTAPFLFAQREFPHLEEIARRKSSEPGDVEEVVRCIQAAKGLEQTRALAVWHAHRALQSVESFAPSPALDALRALVVRVVERSR